MYDKHHPFLQTIKNITSIQDIPPYLRNAPYHSDVLYKDDQMLIKYDVEPDTTTHLQIIPVEHIENQDILDHPDLMRDMYLAGHFISKNSSSINQSYLRVSSKKIDLQGDNFDHFHLHVQSDDPIDHDELVAMLTPGFYKKDKKNG